MAKVLPPVVFLLNEEKRFGVTNLPAYPNSR